MTHDTPPQRPERRRNPRVRISVDVDFTSEHNFYSARTRDISAGGLFIETDIGLPVGSRIQVDLRFLRSHVMVHAEVVWALVGEGGRTEGVGVRFLDLAPRARERIEAFMGLRDPMRAGEVLDDEPGEEERDTGGKKGPPPLPGA